MYKDETEYLIDLLDVELEEINEVGETTKVFIDF